MSQFRGQLILALLFSIGLKLITFILTTYLTRIVLPAQNGIQFTYFVFVDTSLFIAREAVRNTASRYNPHKAAAPLDATANRHGDEGSYGDRCEMSGEVVHEQLHISALTIPLAVVVIALLELQGLLGVHILPSLLSQVTKQDTTTTTTPAAASGTNSTWSADAHYAGHASRVMVQSRWQQHATFLLPYLPEMIVWCSVVLLAWAEPCVGLLQSLDLFHSNVMAEFSMMLARLVTTIALTHSYGMHGIWETRMIFALGQLASALAFTGYYWVVCAGPAATRWVGGSDVIAQARGAVHRACTAACASPTWTSGDDDDAVSRGAEMGVLENAVVRAVWFPWSVLSAQMGWAVCRKERLLLWSFFSESMLRLFLTQGENFAITSLGSTTARGYYQTVTNLGSCVARLIYSVWESACFAKWSREVASGQTRTAVALLVNMLRISFYFGFGFVLLGPPFAEQILTLLYSSRWATAGVVRALRLFFYGLPCMGWNGLLEAFLRAVAPPALLLRLQRYMLGTTILFIVLCYLSLTVWVDTPADSKATTPVTDDTTDAVSRLVVVGILNMIIRCAGALYFILHVPIPTSRSHRQTRKGAAEEKDTDASGYLVQPATLRSLVNGKLLAGLVAVLCVSRVMAPTLVNAVCLTAGYALLLLVVDTELHAVGIEYYKTIRSLGLRRGKSAVAASKASTLEE